MIKLNLIISLFSSVLAKETELNNFKLSEMKLAVKTRYIFSDFSDGDITDEYAVSNKSLSGAAVSLDLKISQTNHIEDLLDTSEECTNKE
jgi:hypothetical protein